MYDKSSREHISLSNYTTSTFFAVFLHTGSVEIFACSRKHLKSKEMNKFFVILYIFLPLSWATDIIISNHEVCTNMAKHFISNHRVSVPELAIVTSVCEAIMNPLDPGLAGGFHASIFHGSCNKGLYLDASVSAPTEYVAGSSKRYGDTGVPLMLKGYQYLYNMNICGSTSEIKWKDLFQENINLAKNGWVATHSVIQKLKRLNHSLIIDEASMRLKNPSLAKTLEKIAEDGPSSSLYTNNSDFHLKMIDELKDKSFISSSDLIKAEVVAKDPLPVYDFMGDSIVTTGSPGSGSCLTLGLKIIDSVIAELRELSPEKQVLFIYHTLRYMHSLKPLLDSGSVSVEKIISNSPIIALGILNILDETWEPEPLSEFGNYKIKNEPSAFTPKSGVNNIIIRRGQFAITMSTVANRRGGQKLFSNDMGMVYNNLLRDFGGTGSKSGKRPPSYSATTILYSKSFDPSFTIGATAQQNPLGSILNVMFHYFVNGKTLEEAANDNPYCTPKYRNGRESVWCDDKVSDKVQMLFADFDVDINFSDHLHGGVTAYSTVRSELETVFDVDQGGAVYVDDAECRKKHPNDPCFGLDDENDMSNSVHDINPKFRLRTVPQ